jgi:hypothetical protein
MEGFKNAVILIGKDLPPGMTLEGIFIAFIIATMLAVLTAIKMMDPPRKR